MTPPSTILFRSRCLSWLAPVALVVAAWSSPVGAQESDGRSDHQGPTPEQSAREKQSRDVRWREDLDTLWMELKHRHPGALERLGEQERQQQVGELDRRIPDLSDDEVHVELMRFVASFGDDHTVLELGRLAAAPLPLGFVQWPDGLRIVAAPKSHAALVGQQVVRVEAFTISDVMLELARVQSMSPHWRIRVAPQFLVHPRLLHGMGLTEHPDRTTFTVRDPEGRETEHTFTAGTPATEMARVAVEKDAVTNQRGARWHHAEWLAEEGLLYVQYNRCATSKEHDLTRFTDQLARLVDQQVEQDVLKILVVDLQYNSGGDSRLGERMFARIASVVQEARIPIYCLIGAGTFSSALMNAEHLKAMYGAVLVGTPTGGAPDHFGEVRSFELPHSKAKVFHSTRRFGQDGERRTTLPPDLHVERTFADFIAGRDPMLDAVRAHAKGR